MRDLEYTSFSLYLMSEPLGAFVRRLVAVRAVAREAREFLALCREEIALNHDLDARQESDEHLYALLEQDRRERAARCNLDPAVTTWRKIFQVEEEEDRWERAVECGLDPETATFAQIDTIEGLRASRIEASSRPAREVFSDAII